MVSMKKINRTLLYILFSVILFPFILSAQTLRIATYNVWNPVFEEKYSGKNTWDSRLPNIIDNILTSQCDILCLEEVSKEAYVDLQDNKDIRNQFLSFYTQHGASQPGQKLGRDGLAFFYRPEKVSLLKFVQSKDHSRPTHRRDFYVDLSLNGTEKRPVQFRIACTHLDSEKDLTIGNTQLSALIEDLLKDTNTNTDFMVLCGDFNEGEDESIRPRAKIMEQAGFFTDGSLETTRPEALDVRHKGHVDWIYFKTLSSLDLNLISKQPIGDEKASDHKLTMTEIEVRE